MSEMMENTDTAEKDFEIEIQDDTPEEDRGRTRKAEEAEAKEPAADNSDQNADDDDLEGYSDKVKKRINKLRFEYHEERRRREEATRLREEAVAYAQRMHEEATNLRKTLHEGEAVLVGQAKARLQVQLEQAKQAYIKAYEAGDAEAVANAQLKLTELKSEEIKLSGFKQPPRPVAQPAPQFQAQPQQQQPQVPTPDPRAVRWASDNTWFGKDEEMTALAFGVHERLVKSGVAPTSEEYYNKIDEAVRRRFPDKFGAAPSEERTTQRSAGTVVAPGGRNTGKSPRKVVLTSSAVALAKRLGLTPEQYAAQLLKDSQNG